MRKYLLVIPLLVLVLACATWKENIVTTYEGIGDTMQVTRDAMISACASGLIDANSCETLKTQYNKVEVLRIRAGDVLADLIVIDESLKIVTDMAKKNELLVQKDITLARYNALINDLNHLLQDLIKVAKETGVKL